MRLIILLLTLLVANRIFADTFTVISNADSGPGTLREAIQKAADNGIGETDNIVFALPGSTKEDKTIIISSSLPDLTSYLIIDGSTQPGTSLSVNGSKVVLDFEVQDVNQTFLHTQQSSNIEIYGLDCRSGFRYTACFIFDGVTNLVFGAPGKGNVISGFKGGLYNLNQALINYDIVIQNNFFGVDETGTIPDAQLPDGAINLMTAYNLTIGGDKAGEGNVICATYVSISTNYTVDYLTGFIDIKGNKIGTDITGTKKLSVGNSTGSLQLQGYHDGSASLGGNTNVRVSIINNIIASSVRLLKFRDTFFIRGNHFGIGADGVTNISQYDLGAAINLFYCNAGTVGGVKETDKNYIANATAGISELYTGNTTISRNSFQCNTGKGIYFNDWVLSHAQPFINVTSVSTTNISGNAPPNSKIELFYSDDCGAICEGKTYIITLAATDRGDWNYTGMNCTNIVATATDTYGATSEFSRAVISEPDVKVINSICGKANGSITGMHVVSGTSWHWEDDKGNIISNNLNLMNVPAGTYVLEASIGSNFCTAKSGYYTVENIDLPTDPQVTISNIACGQSAGSLSLPQSSMYSASWLTENNTVVGNGFAVSNLQPAKYFLQLTVPGEISCTKTYGPYEIKSDVTNSLNVSDVSVKNTTCSNQDGSIRGILYSTLISTDIYVAWEDENGKQWSFGSLDLSSVPAGKYRLKLKDPANCDTLFSPFYIVGVDGNIVTDFSNLHVAGSDLCGHPYGSISGITATNGETFTWTSQQGVIVGATLDINNLKAGTYKLLVSNHYNCTITTDNITVPSVNNPDFANVEAQSKSGLCGVSNGYIHPANISNQNQYNYRWIEALHPDITIDNSLSLDNILSGNFTLNATDRNGCEEPVKQFELPAIQTPVVHEELKLVRNEICSNHDGRITGFTFSGGTKPFIETWKDENGIVVSSNESADSVTAGIYQLYLQDANGCTATSTPINVDNEALFYNTPVYKSLAIPKYSSASLSVSNFQKGTYSLYTSLSALTPVQQNDKGIFTTDVLSEDQTFYIGVSTGSCTSTLAEIVVKVSDETKIAVPAAFTPNGDGINDVFKLKVAGLFTLEDFSIYDRFGNLVFKTKDMHKGWKGDKNGVQLNTGTYIWIVRGKDLHDKPLLLKGTVVLMH